MAQLDDFSPLRTYRTDQYGELTVFEKFAGLHSDTELPATTIMPKGF